MDHGRARLGPALARTKGEHARRGLEERVDALLLERGEDWAERQRERGGRTAAARSASLALRFSEVVVSMVSLTSCLIVFLYGFVKVSREEKMGSWEGVRKAEGEERR